MKKRVLFIQVVEPGAYPPLINAAHIMAEAGWDVTFLAAPFAGNGLRVSASHGVTVINVKARPSFIVSKTAYLSYCGAAIKLARKLKPQLIYASDPLGALPGLLAAKLAGARLFFHEHDSPSKEADLNFFVRWARRLATKCAEYIVFPNVDRGLIAQTSLNFNRDKLRIVWNVPRRTELPTIAEKALSPLILYFHGSITRERLPETVLQAVSDFGGKVRLDVAGYEAAGSPGIMREIMARWNSNDIELVRYLGQIPLHQDLLSRAAQCHVGLSLMPMDSSDVNMINMTGASNKPFDYMAAGLPLIVADLPAWRSMYVDPNYGIACDPRSVDSIKTALSWYLDNNADRIFMAKSCRKKIEDEWNYEASFSEMLLAINKSA